MTIALVPAGGYSGCLKAWNRCSDNCFSEREIEFMKTATYRLFGALCAVAVIISTLAVGTSVKGQGYIASYAGLGPVTRNQGFVNDTVYALANGLSSYGSWTSIPDGSSNNVSSIFHSGATGGCMYWALAVTNSVPFTLASIYSTQTSPFFSGAGTLGDDGLTYTMFGEGISSNGTLYTSGNADTLVNAAYIVGYGFVINISGTPTQAAQEWSSSTPFSVTMSYTVGGQTASVTENFITPVPEPGTLALAMIGIGFWALVILTRKHRAIRG